MNQPVTVDELKNIIALRDLPDEHLEWILAHSTYVEHEDGDVVMKTGEPIDVMWMLLEGKVYFYMNVNGRLVYYFSFENNELTGGVGGLLPFSRMKSSPGTSYAVGKVRALFLHKKYFQELEQLNPNFTQRLIGYMTERARIFATTQMQQEKVSALGKLAAGIAHELNNPASAISRISAELYKRLNYNFELTEEMIKNNVPSDLIRSVREIIQNKNEKSTRVKLSPLHRIRKEEEINEWLSTNGFKGSFEAAETFTEAGLSVDELIKLNSNLGKDAFNYIILWLENLISSELILKDLDTASERITSLVGAIKSHVHMDRSGALHLTDIHSDIENTLMLLEYKLREKNITVKKDFYEELPKVEAYIGELNQVWSNIIDNAIYALPKEGELLIETGCEKNDVVVKITDNGSGIPKDILSRIFDPFFTTKKVGDGTGIGLDLVQNVIKKHSGEIQVNSEPGKTEFKICLPVNQNITIRDIKDETAVHNNN